MLSALSPTVRKDILNSFWKDRTGERHHRLWMFRKYQTFQGENIRLLMERTQITDAVYVGDTKGDADACTFAGIPFILQNTDSVLPLIMLTKSRVSEYWNIPFKKYRSTVRSDTFLLVPIIQTCTFVCHKRTHIYIRYFDMLRMCRIRLISSAFSNVVTSAISCVLDANGSLTNDTLKSPGTFQSDCSDSLPYLFEVCFSLLFDFRFELPHYNMMYHTVASFPFWAILLS